MIPDLTKEILNDIGIKLMGDVIAILKQAKNYVSEVTFSLIAACAIAAYENCI